MVGTVKALILSSLVAVALLNAVMVPELARLTIPAALVMPAMVPVPPKLRVPVLVKLAVTVESAPEPVTFIVPELDKVVVERVPPVFRVEALAKVPAPERAVPTVKVPLLVYVPVTATEPMEVVAPPLNVLVAPEKVWTPVLAVKVVASFVKWPPNE